MKYVFLELESRNGEYEYTHPSVHTLKNSIDLDEWSDEYCRMFWGEGEAEDGGYYFHGGCIWVGVSRVKEISKKEYDILCKYVY